MKRRRPVLTTRAQAEQTNRNSRQKSTNPVRQVTGTPWGRGVLAGGIDRVALTAKGGGRNPTLWHAARCVGEAIGAGELLDEEQAIGLLVAVGCNVGIPRRDAERQVRRGIDKGKASPKLAPKSDGLRDRTDALALTATWWAEVQSAPWRGRQGATTLRILAAFAILAASAGKVRISESYRQIAEVAGMSAGTVARHRPSWQPWVRLVHRGHAFTGAASEWQLVVRDAKRGNGNIPEGVPPGNHGLFPNPRFIGAPSSDLWERWSTGWLIYRLLPARETITAAEVATLTGLHPDTVRRTLKRLAEHGLAFRINRFEWRGYEQPEAPPGLVSERRRRRHEQERTLWRIQKEARAEQQKAGGVG
jgi:DNA-binding transcriptional ArsR family regulator/alkylated DNA nucleotide flippase Atl1